jgi:glycosyltransferase involved in cell wall biosynthesis
MTSSVGLSVIVCCFNSALRIEKTLNSIALQHEVDFTWEVILVNNASTDNTVEIALETWKLLNIPDVELRIVEQPIPGLNNARIKGAEEAKYDYIIFCDDDNWLDEKYVLTSFRLLETNEHIGAIGGQSIGISEVEFPEWWDTYKDGYAVGKQSAKSGDLTARNYVWGAGMVTKKALFIKAFPKNFPSLLFDRTGKDLSSGGDSEYCMRLILMGFRLYFDESLKFKHFISKERLTETYRDRLFESFQKSKVILNEYSYQINFSQFSRLKKTKLLIKAFMRLIICKMSSTKRWSEEIQLSTIYRITGFALGNLSSGARIISDFARQHGYR